MKNLLFLILIFCLIINVNCSKAPYIEVLSTSNDDRVMSIYRLWDLNIYSVKTDGMYYTFGRPDILSHALRTLKFHGDGTYTAADAAWSGTFEIAADSTQLVLKPIDMDWISMHFSIDYLSPQQIQFSTPLVNVNPVDPEALDYEKLIAFQGLSWLYNRNLDTSNIRALRIQFTYY